MSKSILLTAPPPRHYFKRQARRIKVLEAEEMRRKEESRYTQIACLFLCALGCGLKLH